MLSQRHYDPHANQRQKTKQTNRNTLLIALTCTIMSLLLAAAQLTLPESAKAAPIGWDSGAGQVYIQRSKNGELKTWDESFLVADGAWAYCCAVDEHFVPGDATPRDAIDYFGGRQDVVTALAFADYAVWHNMYCVPGGDYNTTSQEKYAIAQVLMWQILNQYGYSDYDWFGGMLSYEGARRLTGNEDEGCNYWNIVWRATDVNGDVQKYFRGHATVYDAGPNQDIIGKFSLDGAITVEKGSNDPTVMYDNDGYDLQGAVIGAYTSDPRVAKNNTSAILTAKSDPVAAWEMIENADGTVSFKNKVTGNFLDAYGGTAAKYDGNPVVTWDQGGAVESRSWYKNDRGDGKFSFGNYVTSNQMLCPVGASGWSYGTRVWTWNAGTDDNICSWKIENNSDGSVSLRHTGSGLYLGIGENATFGVTDESGRATIGNLTAGDIILYEVAGPNAGYKIDTSKKEVTVSSYQFSPALFTEEAITGSIEVMKVDSNTNEPLSGVTFGIWNSETAAQNEVDAETDEFEGEFIIASDKAPHLVLDVYDGSLNNSANIQAWISNGTEAQRWTFEPSGTEGYYYIKNVKSGKVLDIYNGDVTAGSNVQQYEANGGPGQLWKPVQVSDGVYELVSSGGSGSVVMDMDGGITLRGTNILVWNRNGDANQHWQLHRVGEEYVGSLTTGSNGKASLSGLPIGTYYVKETVFPIGYIKPSPVPIYEVKVTGEGVFQVNDGQVGNSKEETPEPSIRTSLSGESGKTIEVIAGSSGDVTLTDTVTYSNLTPGQSYTLSGKLMNKTTETQFGDITGTKTFTPESANGTAKVTFTIPISSLTQTIQLVAYETLSIQGGDVVCSHENINDTGQTVKINITSFTPAIETTLGDANGRKEIIADGNVTLTDIVTCTSLTPNTSYKLVGTLYDTANNSVVSGPTEKEFSTANTNNAEVRMNFTVNASQLAGKSIVACQILYIAGEDEAAASHEDKTDVAQTVHFPKIATAASDKATGTQVALASGSQTIVDALEYTNLTKNKEYSVTTKLVDSSTGTAISGATKTTVLKPSSASGTAQIEIPVSASNLAGKTVTVYEEIYDGTYLVAKHTDKADTTQQVRFPEISTVLTGPDNVKEVQAIGTVTLEDKISYANLLPNQEYKLEGKLVNANGTAVGSTVTKTFTPESASGTVSMSFSINAASMAGKKVIAYETLTLGGKKVAEHADLADSDQTVTFPGGHTTATDKTTGTHVSLASGTRTITDEVSYTGLTPSKQYTLTGTLMDKETGEPLTVGGSTVTATKTFTPQAADGTVTIDFTFDASALEGKTVVAFETVSSDGQDVFIHADINDAPQTVFFPSVKTKALAANGTQTTQPGPNTKISDTITYTNVIAGQSYRVEGTLVDSQTSQPIKISGQEVTASTTFTAAATSGTANVTFEFDSTNVNVPNLVVFERLYDGTGKLIGIHEDVNDKDQTISFIDIGTTALDNKTGTHEQLAEETSTITDTVAYKNLIPGKEYTVTGTLYDKATGTALSDGHGGDVTASKTFTPESANGTIDIVFTVPSAALAGKTYVAFEDLYQDGKKVATHAEIEDENQTIYVPKVGTTATDKTSGLHERQTGNAVVVDVIAYTNLQPGREYTLSGYLVKKSDGSKLSGSEKTITFKPTAANGTVSIEFPCDASQLTGETVVAFETVSYNNIPVAVHMDITDKEQAVRIIDISTTAKNAVTGLQMIPAEGSVTITDTVAYTNLAAGTQYTMSGTIVDKATPDTVIASATAQFTPSSADGTIDLSFQLNASALSGHDLVCFEELQQSNKTVAVHRDIDDEGQTVHVVSIGTKVLDADTGTNDVLAREETKVIDTVSYSNLIPGIEYKLEGSIIDKKTGEPWKAENGEAVIGTTTFTPEEPNGEIEVEFILDTSKMAGKELVCFEVLYIDTTIIASHEDLNDENQEFTVPGVETTATDGVTGFEEQLASETATIIDTVSYTGLHPDKEYKVIGTLMVYDEDGGHPLTDGNGEPVTSEKEFTPKKADGTIELTFSFDSSLLAGETLVVFEDLYRDDKKIAIHADIEDVPQTVYIPKIGTKATDSETKEHVALADEKRVITDEVAYENLRPGKTYEMTGTLMDKETGQPLNGVKPVTVEFTPEETNGSVTLSFEIDTRALAGRSIVAFETCTRDEKEVAVHADIDDEGQTIHIPEIGTIASVVEDPNNTERVRVVDIVSYKNLPVGLEYEVSGSLMDKAGHTTVVTATPVRFTPETPDGTVEVEFIVDINANMDKTLVAFEDVTYSGHLVGRHADYNDAAQTVEFGQRQIKITSTGDAAFPLIAIGTAMLAAVSYAIRRRRYNAR